ncbi:hypothetical protein RHOSPDRAFT_33679 [Rhodotorula sp. JG-1b]|nr:hypothetical protein RHOSPDRAFT_33679 [Rhodotorula sp. JG-1b]
MASISAKSAARKLPLWSFIARESPASLPSTPFATPAPFSGPSNPFLPTKNGGAARSWTRPKYSLRRQKQLRRAAEQLGFDADAVLPAPHLKQDAPLAKAAAPPSERLDAARRLLVGSPHVQGSRILDHLAMPKVGPYAGRRGAPFKGKLWERQKQARLSKLRTLLQGADARIEAWRKAEAAAKSKGKASLPF